MKAWLILISLLVLAGASGAAVHALFTRPGAQCSEIAVTGTIGKSRMGIGPDDKLYLTAVTKVECKSLEVPEGHTPVINGAKGPSF